MQPVPVACDLSSLDAAKRQRRAELEGIVRANATRIEETATGYRLHFRRSDEMARQVEELIGLERTCCPFLTMQLGDGDLAGDMVFEVGGSVDAKPFLAWRAGSVLPGGGAT